MADRPPPIRVPAANGNHGQSPTPSPISPASRNSLESAVTTGSSAVASTSSTASSHPTSMTPEEWDAFYSRYAHDDMTTSYTASPLFSSTFSPVAFFRCSIAGDWDCRWSNEAAWFAFWFWIRQTTTGAEAPGKEGWHRLMSVMTGIEKARDEDEKKEVRKMRKGLRAFVGNEKHWWDDGDVPTWEDLKRIGLWKHATRERLERKGIKGVGFGECTRWEWRMGEAKRRSGSVWWVFMEVLDGYKDGRGEHGKYNIAINF